MPRNEARTVFGGRGDSNVTSLLGEFLGAAEEYNTAYANLAQQRPTCCLGCSGTAIMAPRRATYGHGSYKRWVVYADRDVLMAPRRATFEVRRWRCKNCRKTMAPRRATFSILPSVVHGPSDGPLPLPALRDDSD